MRALSEIPMNDAYKGGRLLVKLGWDEGQEPTPQ